MIFFSIIIINIFIVIALHPLSAGLNLIICTVLIRIFSSILIKKFWFSYILILIFVGGILVLFIYIISLSPNKKFKISIKFLILSVFFVIIIYIIFRQIIFIFELNFNFKSSINSNFYSSVKLFNSSSSLFTISSVLYLFLVIISVNKITKSNKGPLRAQLYV